MPSAQAASKTTSQRPKRQGRSTLWAAGGPGFSSKSDNWATQPAVFAALDAEFGFTLDVCASADNHKCDRYFTAQDDGLAQDWAGSGHEVVWCNPPYGSHGGGIAAWMAKALASSRAGATVVCLIPSRTETGWWHESVMQAAEIRLVKGRLAFGDSKSNAPFGSAIAVFRPGHEGGPKFTAVAAKALKEGISSHGAMTSFGSRARMSDASAQGRTSNGGFLAVQPCRRVVPAVFDANFKVR